MTGRGVIRRVIGKVAHAAGCIRGIFGRRLPALAAILFASVSAAQAEGITSAQFADPTGRYDHAILGDAIEYGALILKTDTGRRLRVTLPETHVFEDIEPRLADLDRDGENEVVVIETDIARGASISVYGTDGLIAATPHIGSTHRWLAPIGIADLDGDGLMEIAYVDRPHLARVIRVWRFQDGSLELAGEIPGFTNHRIGEDNIAGGVRDCGQGPEMIVTDSAWRDIYAVRFDGSGFHSEKLGPHDGRGSFDQALACQ